LKEVITIKVLDPLEMKKADQYTIESRGIPSIVLMERAAHSAVRAILEFSDSERYPTENRNSRVKNPEKVLVLCGIGNNGGDGLAAARELSDLGWRVTVLVLTDKAGHFGINKLSGNAGTEFNLLKDTDVEIIADPDYNNLDLTAFDLYIDAIFGTGLSRRIPGFMEAVLQEINTMNGLKVALDVPTGIDSRNGLLYADNPFKADMTVSFAFPKTGLLFYPAREYVGQLRVTYIGISSNTPEELGRADWKEKYLMNHRTARRDLPVRKPDGYKGTFGRVAVIGGSHRYRGAPVLALKAALKSGTGLLTGIMPCMSPGKTNPVYSFGIPPEIMLNSPPESLDFHGFNSLNTIIDSVNEQDVVLLGPGMGREYSTQCLVLELITQLKMPLVLDADALFALAGEDVYDFLSKNSKEREIVLTPHIVEFSRLIKKDPVDIRRNLVDEAVDFSSRTGTTLVLKGATTIVATPLGQAVLNISGNQGLATGGSGDCLGGMIASFIGQGLNAVSASKLGVYLHGLTSDLYAENGHAGSFTPTDLINYIPLALSRVDG